MLNSEVKLYRTQVFSTSRSYVPSLEVFTNGSQTEEWSYNKKNVKNTRKLLSYSNVYCPELGANDIICMTSKNYLLILIDSQVKKKRLILIGISSCVILMLKLFTKVRNWQLVRQEKKLRKNIMDDKRPLLAPFLKVKTNNKTT